MTNPVIIDAHSIIIRNIMASALDDLKAGDIWTGGVYGTLNTIRKVLTLPEIKPQGIYAFFDHGVPKFRRELFPEYKAERKERKHMLTDAQREKAFTQIHTAREMLELLGVTCLAYRDMEADDGVAAAAILLREKNPVVVSGDKDLWQLVNHGAQVWYTGSKASYMITDDNFKDRVAESFKCEGVHPEMYLLFKALVGDPSDGIKGAEGCGPKRAAAMVNECADEALTWDCYPKSQLHAVCSNLDKKDKLRKFEESVIGSREWLEKVLKGIDLSHSFGGTTGLKKALAHKPKVQKIKFLKFCRKLHFNSVIGDPERYVKPFENAVTPCHYRRPGMNLTDPTPVYRYRAEYVRNYDGDTVRVSLDLGFGVWLKNQAVRLLGVDTAELRGGTDESKEHARAAKLFVERALTTADDIVIETIKDKSGKYGRWLAVIWFKTNLGWTNLNKQLLTEGLAKEYMK